MNRQRLLLLSVGVVAALAASSRDADACGVVIPDPATCTDRFLVPNETLPSNLGAIAWTPSFTIKDIAGANATLVRDDNGVSQPVPYTLEQARGGTVWLVPSAALVPGARYTFSRTATCQIGERHPRTVSTTFTATAPVTVAKSFGGAPVASAVTSKTLRRAANGCPGTGSEVDVDVRSVVVTPAADAPIRAALPYAATYDARIDGVVNRVHGTPSGDGIELQAHCGTAAGASPISPGVHTVQLYATYPGSTELVASDPVEVDLSCSPAAAEEPSSSGGCNAGGTRTGAAGGLAIGLAAVLAARLRSRRKR